MRIKDDTPSVLIDLPLVQADRLNNPYFQRALDQGAFDPFPDGSVTDGAVAKNSGSFEARLAHGPLTKFDGALPDHIQFAMLAGLCAEDAGLRDFLAIFDRRLLQLQLRVERAAVLVSTQDQKGQRAASILSRLLQMLARGEDDPRLLKLLMPLLSRTRSFAGLRDILAWWTGSPVEISADFKTMRPIDRDSLGRLTSCPETGVALGQGAILGRFGRTPMGHISVHISCANRAELNRIIADTDALAEMRSIAAQYLRDRAPVTFFANLTRACLNAPRLSATAAQADRLGAYNLLNPARHPHAAAQIKLTQIPA